MIEIEKRIDKYRAWNRENKTMDYDGGFLYDLSDFNIEQHKYLSLNIFISKITEELDLMRFIGSHDRQGKEIYEGDIVKWREQLDNGDDNEHIIRNDEIFGIVLWNKEECRFIISQITKGKWIYKVGEMISEYDAQFYSYDGSEFEWKDLEVIGNIYENPDIYNELKQEK